MKHQPFLKFISQEPKNGRMVDTSSFSVCRCGEKFPTDELLENHTLQSPSLQPALKMESSIEESEPAYAIIQAANSNATQAAEETEP